MIKEISITTKNQQKHVMSVDSYSRWLCLLEAVSLIGEKAQ